MYTPGYYSTRTNYILEADIYTLSDDGELIYSAQLKSFDPQSAETMANGFAKAISTELKEKGILSNK